MEDKIIPIRFNKNVYRQFKAAVALEGKTIKEEIEKLMKDYIRRKNARNSSSIGDR